MKFKSYIMISSHIMITLECNKMNTGAVHINTLQVFGSFVGFFFFFLAKHDSLYLDGLGFVFLRKDNKADVLRFVPICTLTITV